MIMARAGKEGEEASVSMMMIRDSKRASILNVSVDTTVQSALAETD